MVKKAPARLQRCTCPGAQTTGLGKVSQINFVTSTGHILPREGATNELDGSSERLHGCGAHPEWALTVYCVRVCVCAGDWQTKKLLAICEAAVRLSTLPSHAHIGSTGFTKIARNDCDSKIGKCNIGLVMFCFAGGKGYDRIKAMQVCLGRSNNYL